jgi:hypothetical protein
MEKVKIKSAKDTGKKSNGLPITKIELEDGRKGSSLAADAISWEGEMELNITDAQPYNGEPQFYFSLPKKGFPQRSFPQKDYIFEKRNASLQRAIETAALVKPEVTSKQILIIANKYFEYLNS